MDKSEFYIECTRQLKQTTDPATQGKIKSLTKRVMAGSLSVESALNELMSRPKATPLYESLSRKHVGQSIRKYFNKTLSESESMKMVSSVITHCLIENSLNESFSLNKDVAQLSESLTEYITTGSVNHTKINESLSNLGLNQEVNTIE